MGFSYRFIEPQQGAARAAAAGLILFGAQETNRVIAKLADRLPMLLAVRKAWPALTTYLDTKGDLGNVCEGAGKKNDYQYCIDRPRESGDMHGQAPVLWCATALPR